MKYANPDSLTPSEAVEIVYPDRTDDIRERAQRYMQSHNLGFCFLETGELIINDDLNN